jgi:hypothetical protein
MKIYETETGRKRCPEFVSDPVSSCAFLLLLNFRLYNPTESLRFVYHFLVMFSFLSVSARFQPQKSIAIMSSSGSSEENSLADINNTYMRELKMHPKELSLKDGKV